MDVSKFIQPVSSYRQFFDITNNHAISILLHVFLHFAYVPVRQNPSHRIEKSISNMYVIQLDNMRSNIRIVPLCILTCSVYEYSFPYNLANRGCYQAFTFASLIHMEKYLSVVYMHFFYVKQNIHFDFIFLTIFP